MLALALALAALSLASFAALLAVTGVRAYRSAQSGAALLADAARLAGGGDVDASERQLQRAERAFGSASTELDRWWLWPVERLPLVHRQVKAARALAQSGSRLAVAGQRVVREVAVDDVRLVDGALDIGAVARLGDPLEAGLAALRQGHGEVSRARVRWLLPPLDRRLAQVSAQLSDSIVSAETSVLATRVLPDLFGATGPRRYFLAIQTPAEPRGTGGMIGNFGEVTAEGGRLRLARLGRTAELNQGGDPAGRRLSGPADYLARYGRFRPERTWQNVTMSPDFPSVAKVIDDLYPQSGGQPVDGVVGVDPFALAAFLELTGPVTVPEWPEPLTADNAADVLVRQQYLRFENSERVDFLDAVARAVFDRLTTTALPPFPTVARVLAPVIRSRHLMMWSDRADEQALFERLGATGGLPEVRGDFVAAVVQDATGSKLAPYLQRSVRYAAVFDPANGEVRADAVVRLDNQAPSSGLPATVTGESPGRLPGHNRVYLSLYTPLLFQGATLDGRPVLMESERELSRNVYSAFVTIPPGQSATLVAHLAGPVQVDGDYRLDIVPQPAVTTDDVDVEVRVAGGGIVAADGLDARGDVARGRFPLSEDRVIRLRTQGVPVSGPRWRLELVAVAALLLAAGLHLRDWRRGAWAWAWAGPGPGPPGPAITATEPPKGGQRARRRVQAVSIRTLRRTAEIVGENHAGEPIVKVGAVRLVLPHGATTFRHLISCSRCGKETASQAVWTSAHLRIRSSAFCHDCAGRLAFVPSMPPDRPNGATEHGGRAPAGGPTAGGVDESGDLRDPAVHPARNGTARPPMADTIPRPRGGTNGGELTYQVSAAVARWFEQHKDQLLAELRTTMGADLQQHREALVREAAALMAQRVSGVREWSAVAIRWSDDRQEQVAAQVEEVLAHAWPGPTTETTPRAGGVAPTVETLRTMRGPYPAPNRLTSGLGLAGSPPGSEEVGDIVPARVGPPADR